MQTQWKRTKDPLIKSSSVTPISPSLHTSSSSLPSNISIQSSELSCFGAKMVGKKSRIVIIGAGMAGVTAANKLYTTIGSNELFELVVVEGGSRIGGRINTSEFGGDRIEMGATWIHGIGGSPVHKIAQEIGALESELPWECMDGSSDEPTTVAEGGLELNTVVVDPISSLFKNLMDYAQGKVFDEMPEPESNGDVNFKKPGHQAFEICAGNGGLGKVSVGEFLRQGLDAYWVSKKNQGVENGCGNWCRKLLEEAIFAMHENTQRTYTSAGDLLSLDYNAESEYRMFAGEEITIAKGYLSIVQSLASVLPPGLIQLGKRVTKIEWKEEGYVSNGYESDDAKPVKLQFSDGSVMSADHVIVTVSLGVLKASIQQDSPGLFYPPLPLFKTEAISRLGFGVVNKLFLQLASHHPLKRGQDFTKFPFLQMVFHRQDSEFRQKKIPWWMRKTASICPLYHHSSVLLSWFAGDEALELESLKDEEIINGVSSTISSFLSNQSSDSHSHELCNGNGNPEENCEVKFGKVLKSQWGSDPLFLGSYSYVAVGSSGEDLDTMAEPLPKSSSSSSSSSPPPLQILFAGEATHRTHYSTTHGAYFSGLREANRLLQHYQNVGV